MHIAAAKLARKLHKKGAAGVRPPSNFHDKTNVRLKRVLWRNYFFYRMRVHKSFLFFMNYSVLFFEATFSKRRKAAFYRYLVPP